MENPVLTQPGKNGGTLKRGGVNPGAGRPTNEFRQECRKLTADTLPVMERIIKGTARRGQKKEVAPAFSDSRGAWSDVAKMGYGEAKVLIPEEFVPILGRVLGEEESIPMEVIERVVTRMVEALKGL